MKELLIRLEHEGSFCDVNNILYLDVSDDFITFSKIVSYAFMTWAFHFFPFRLLPMDFLLHSLLFL